MMRLRRIYDPVHKTLWKQASNGLLNGSCTYISNAQLPVPMRLGETPVPIPNTTVKTQTADGTALETMWESRRAPDQEKNRKYPDHIYSAQSVLDGSVSHARGEQKDRGFCVFFLHD